MEELKYAKELRKLFYNPNYLEAQKVLKLFNFLSSPTIQVTDEFSNGFVLNTQVSFRLSLFSMR